MRSHSRNWTPRRRDERGVALLEFALVIPLFFMMLWGIVALAALSRARQQLDVVHHAVVRHAAGGEKRSEMLERYAKSYADAAGLRSRVRVTVRASSIGTGLGGILPVGLGWVAGASAFAKEVRSETEIRLPVISRLRGAIPDRVTLVCINTVVPDTWSNNFGITERLFGHVSWPKGEAAR